MRAAGTFLPGVADNAPPSAADLVMQPGVIVYGDEVRAPEVSSAAPDVDLDTMLIHGKRLSLDVRGAVIGGDGIDRKMDGASTVKFDILDPTRSIMRSGIFKRGSELEIDGLGFTLVGIDRNEDVVSLTFEDREIHWLRGYDSPLKVWKDRMTRGQFIHVMVREVKEGTIKFWCPEEDEVLNVDAPARAALRGVDHPTPHSIGTSQRGVSRRKSSGRFKASKYNAKQLHNINLSMDEAFHLNAPYMVMVDMCTAALGESGFDDDKTDYATHTHKGVFQSNIVPQHDTQQQAHYFLVGGHSFLPGGAIGYRKAHPSASHGEVASQVEISNGNAAYYEANAKEAKSIVDGYIKAAGVTPSSGGKLTDVAVGNIAQGGGDLADAAVNTLGGNREVLPDKRVKRLAFQRGVDGKREDSWDCMNRLCHERGVNWNPFMVNGWLYVVSDSTLSRLAIQATINPDTPGVHEINYSIDSSKKKVDEVTVTCQADRWALPPGSRVLLDEKNDLEIFGDWLVYQISRPMFAKDAEITLRKTRQPTQAPKQNLTQLARTGGRSLADLGTKAISPVRGAKPGVPVAQLTQIGPLHQTDGLPGYPAHDYFAPAGSPCVSPVDGKVWKLSGHDPRNGPTNGPHGPFGLSVYISGGGKSYYLTHMGSRTVRLGDRVRQGEKIGTVGDYAKWGGANHIHMGVHG